MANGFAALNQQLAVLRAHAIALPKELPHTIDIMRDSRGGGDDTLHFGGDSGDDVLHYTSGHEGEEEARLARVARDRGIRGGAIRPINGLRAGATVIADAKKQIDDHVEKTKSEFNDTAADVVKNIGDMFNKRDKGLQEILKYVEGRTAVAGYTGTQVLMNVTNILRDMKDALNRGDAKRMVELEKQLRDFLHVINDLLVGRGNQNAPPLDENRLLSNFNGFSTGFAP